MGERISEIEAISEDEAAEVEERKAMAIWARLQVKRPAIVSDDQWRLAVNDAGLFLDRLGAQGVQFGWSPADLFDVPREGKQGGLIWFLRGDRVRALGPEHAVTESERVFDCGDPTHTLCSRS
jgi:hypothetical protein